MRGLLMGRCHRAQDVHAGCITSFIEHFVGARAGLVSTVCSAALRETEPLGF